MIGIILPLIHADILNQLHKEAQCLSQITLIIADKPQTILTTLTVS